MVRLDNALEFALEIARAGGEIAMKHYQKGLSLQRKIDGTWVTEADLAVEAELRARVAKAWPTHNFFGEEDGLAAADGGPALEGAPTWIVDPIDGTHNYMSGIPIWGTLVALRAEGGFVVGVCDAPALGETYDAARGMGARMNGATIEAESVGALSEATTLFGGGAFVEPEFEAFLDRLVMKSWRIRGFGDFWGHMLVARGAAHVMFEPDIELWDAAALVPIVTEAGATITHLDGSPWLGKGSCLTTCTSLHDEVVALGGAGL